MKLYANILCTRMECAIVHGVVEGISMIVAE